MALPKLFIGSSKKNIEITKILANALESDNAIQVKVWDEDVFGLNEGFLETLLETIKEYEFAAFVLAGDDITTSNDESKPSPRDNVLFESGLFMGALGSNNVFLIYDQAIEVKIPSDFAGITLASYDGNRINEGEAAVRNASYQIRKKIREQSKRFPNLCGKWKSIYPMPFEENSPQAEEIVEICAYREGISIITLENTRQDFYQATGRIVEGKIIGDWRSRREDNDSYGVFMLTVSPDGNYMYGYFTGPDERGGITYAYWILARTKETDEVTINRRLLRGKDMLKSSTIGL
jgi:hypothetical protein